MKAALARCPLFAQASDTTIDQIAAVAVERHIAPHRIIAAQDEPFPYLGVVLEGSVLAMAAAAGGREQRLYEASEGETFGEIPLLDNEATLSHLAAGDRGAVTVLIPKRALEGACRSDAALALRLARATAHRARILTERLEDLAFASTTTRIARVILSFAPNSNGATPDWVEAPIELRQLSQTRIADLAGTVRVVVARALRTLTDDGALVMDHGRVVRLNRAALAHVV